MATGEDSAVRPRGTRRPARWTDDAPFLERLYASTRADELAHIAWTDAQKADFCRWQSNAQHTHYQKHYPDAAFEVIELDGTPAGRIYVDRGEKEIYDRRGFELAEDKGVYLFLRRLPRGGS